MLYSSKAEVLSRGQTFRLVKQTNQSLERVRAIMYWGVACTAGCDDVQAIEQSTLVIRLDTDHITVHR